MTPTEIEEGNRIIAEFMGVKIGIVLWEDYCAGHNCMWRHIAKEDCEDMTNQSPDPKTEQEVPEEIKIWFIRLSRKKLTSNAFKEWERRGQQLCYEVAYSEGYEDASEAMYQKLAADKPMLRWVKASAAQVLGGFIWENMLPTAVISGSVSKGFEIDQDVLLSYLMKFQEFIYKNQSPEEIL